MAMKSSSFKSLQKTTYPKFCALSAVSLAAGLALILGPQQGWFSDAFNPKLVAGLGVLLLTVFACALITCTIRYRKENISDLLSFSTQSIESRKSPITKSKGSGSSAKKSAKKKKSAASKKISRKKKR